MFLIEGCDSEKPYICLLLPSLGTENPVYVKMKVQSFGQRGGGHRTKVASHPLATGSILRVLKNFNSILRVVEFNRRHFDVINHI